MAEAQAEKSKVKNIENPEKVKVPSDFAERLATKIIVINEREMDDLKRSTKIADALYRNLSKPEMQSYFDDCIFYLLNHEETPRYAAIAWASLIIQNDDHPEYKGFVEDSIEHIIFSHRTEARPPVDLEFKNKKFSAYALYVGELFINMMRVNSDLYDVVTEIFSEIIRQEMAISSPVHEEEEDRKSSLLARKKRDETPATVTKKLYDDTIDYISARSEHKSDSLNQKNPNEFIIVLADRLRSTRRYIIQDIMNKNTLERKKQIEKELKEQEANAEEIIAASEPFSKGMGLFWVEKRYNFKYLAVEKIRISMQIFAILLGLGSVIFSFLEIEDIQLLEALAVAVIMIGYSKLFCSRKFFQPFYPKDVTADLEQQVGMFTPIFRKMSESQLESFLARQIKNPNNEAIVTLIPEYVRYIYAVLPDRNKLLIGSEDLQKALEQTEINISKFQRGRTI